MKCSIDTIDITRRIKKFAECEYQGLQLVKDDLIWMLYIRKNRERISSPMQHGAQDKL